MKLNVDLGELADEPEELYALADVANIAAGGHAGDAASMRAAATLCARYDAMVAAHPSYPDRAGFGRVSQAIAADELARCVEAQCAALARACGSLRVVAVKPHGALYHDAARSPALADAVIEGARAALGDVVIVGPPGGALREAAVRFGLSYAREGFADRAYGADGLLVPRTQKGAMIDDPVRAATQAVRLAREGLETICVHGDGPHAVAIARAVRAALDALR